MLNPNGSIDKAKRIEYLAKRKERFEAGQAKLNALSWWDLSRNLGWDELPPKWRPFKRIRWLRRQHRINALEITLKIYLPKGSLARTMQMMELSHADTVLTLDEYKAMFK